MQNGKVAAFLTRPPPEGRNVQSKLKITLLFASALVTAHAQSHHNADAQKKSAEVEQQAAKTAEEIIKYEIQLDKTERALSSVAQATDGTELKKRYAYFRKEVDTLGKAPRTCDVRHSSNELEDQRLQGVLG